MLFFHVMFTLLPSCCLWSRFWVCAPLPMHLIGLMVQCITVTASVYPSTLLYACPLALCLTPLRSGCWLDHLFLHLCLLVPSSADIKEMSLIAPRSSSLNRIKIIHPQITVCRDCELKQHCFSIFENMPEFKEWVLPESWSVLIPLLLLLFCVLWALICALRLLKDSAETIKFLGALNTANGQCYQ